ncbi:MAG: formate/nitrite transporter family protein [Pseudomonadota bacterium]|jgi:formate/nitrite transporter
MASLFGSDAYTPAEISARIESVGVTKARLPLLQMVVLSLLGGAFIGLGALVCMLVLSDATLGYAASRLLAGLVFSLGLLLVVVAGAELFTGNNLLAMAWADGRIGTGELLRCWLVVCAGNFAGALVLAMMVWLSGHASGNAGAIAAAYVQVATAKCELPLPEAFWRGVLCNVLVCLAVWMAAAGRSVIDKAVAIVPPVTVFVAAGFEHSVANMFVVPMALLLEAASPAAVPGLDLVAFLERLAVVIAGNLVGGSVLVALVYHLIYRRGQPS